MIEVIQASALCLVQDIGRFGQRGYGVGSAGAMDSVAIQAGNLMLGNDPNAAAIEINLLPLKLKFHEKISISLTGGDFEANVDGCPIPPWWAITINEGQVLTLTEVKSGSRAYLCIEGGIDVPNVLGSRSTQLRGAIGGFEGRSLKRGDFIKKIKTSSSKILDFGIEPPNLKIKPLFPFNDTVSIRVMRASEYDEFSPESLDKFWNTEWLVTPQSNRAGYRLYGEKLELTKKREMRSHGIVSGIIQVPPGGHPIIQLSDANVSGGYPKIATVISADKWRLAQTALNRKIKFIDVTRDEAISALNDINSYLDYVKSCGSYWNR